ncbi:hypothetical protein ACH5RR_007967 [Cinchona calisaya]|uniref:RNase H type-1 domain-containing protein n=1 Tax=Cinchona calisaya TaxID=153742 RepID=A0ABD3ADY1_9GENT
MRKDIQHRELVIPPIERRQRLLIQDTPFTSSKDKTRSKKKGGGARSATFREHLLEQLRIYKPGMVVIGETKLEVHIELIEITEQEIYVLLQSSHRLLGHGFGRLRHAQGLSFSYDWWDKIKSQLRIQQETRYATNIVVELWGLRNGLILAVQKNLKFLEIEVDASVVIGLVKNADLSKHYFGNVIFDCKSLLSSLQQV